MAKLKSDPVLDLLQLEKARANLLKVRSNVVKKCAVSTTAAQGHLSVLTNVSSDLGIIEALIESVTPKAKPAKPTTTDKDK